MAKRKRLSPAQSGFLGAAGPVSGPVSDPLPGAEAKSLPIAPAPIAQVAGEAATSAALQELAGEMTRAREEGRLIQTLALDQVEDSYLVRDRLFADDEDLQALVNSIRARGQQTPIEVVALPRGRYGLISGWRRLTALRHLFHETGAAAFSQVKALLRQPETAADAYVAMVEENEIRVGLSYYERARVAAKAVEQRVFETEKAALLSLYDSASRAKRSKIRSFLRLYHAADDLLRFPSMIGERLGLAVAKRLDHEAGAAHLRGLLAAAPPDNADQEQAILHAFAAERDTAQPTIGANQTASPQAPSPQTPPPEPTSEPTSKPITPASQPGSGRQARALGPGIEAVWDQHELTLSGPGMSAEFRERLCAWVLEQNGPG
ncbi:MAG: ParB N-terminal domain-containing protein [Pseudomonadota bacterium]